MTDEAKLTCDVCGNTAYGPMSKLIDDGWIPEYWIRETDEGGPACPACVEHRIGRDPDGGEFILKPKTEWTR
jgi:hypothetical protein